MKSTPLFTGLLALALMMPSVASADISIDDYTAGSTLAQFGAGTNLQTLTDASFLGTRDTSLTVTNASGPNGFGIIGFGPLAGPATMNVAQGVTGRINGGVAYSNFGTIDLTQGGANDQFTVNIASSDINTATSGVLSVTANSNSGSFTQQLTIPASSGLPSNVDASFSDFAGVDFSQITSLSMDFDFANAPGRDFSIGSFAATSAVPEPGSLTLLAGLAMVGVARRRRR